MNSEIGSASSLTVEDEGKGWGESRWISRRTVRCKFKSSGSKRVLVELTEGLTSRNRQVQLWFERRENFGRVAGTSVKPGHPFTADIPSLLLTAEVGYKLSVFNFFFFMQLRENSSFWSLYEGWGSPIFFFQLKP